MKKWKKVIEFVWAFLLFLGRRNGKGGGDEKGWPDCSTLFDYAARQYIDRTRPGAVPPQMRI